VNAVASSNPTRTAAVLVDTGILVAVFNRLHPQHAAATAWLARNTAPMLTVEAVLSDAAFFLPPRLRAALAGLAARGVLQVRSPDAAGHARMAQLFERYADQDPDWADLALVWLAEAAGVSHIATLDRADFSVYRINGRKRFELALLA
jgi:predicted nucleic acid-binding protein